MIFGPIGQPGPQQLPGGNDQGNRLITDCSAFQLKPAKRRFGDTGCSILRPCNFKSRRVLRPLPLHVADPAGAVVAPAQIDVDIRLVNLK